MNAKRLIRLLCVMGSLFSCAGTGTSLTQAFSLIPQREWKSILPRIQNFDSLLCARLSSHGSIEIDKALLEYVSPDQHNALTTCIAYNEIDMKPISDMSVPIGPGGKRLLVRLYDSYFGKLQKGDMALEIVVADTWDDHCDVYRGSATVFLVDMDRESYSIALILGRTTL